MDRKPAPPPVRQTVPTRPGIEKRGSPPLPRPRRKSGRGVYLALDFGDFPRAAGTFEIIEVLKIEPKFGIGVEVASQAESGLSGDPATLVHNFANPGGRNVEFERELVDRQAEGLHKILAEDFAGMDRRHQRLVLSHDVSQLVCREVRRSSAKGELMIGSFLKQAACPMRKRRASAATKP